MIPEFGDAAVLRLSDLSDPIPGANEVLIRVAAAGVNRADISQRRGHYPPPAGSPDWPGMEVSGTIEALGDGVSAWAVGDRVCALLPGGGYAELAVADAGLLLPVPEDMELVDAAALPEAICTVWSNVVMLAGLSAGETLLVHGGSSGIGTMAIQLATALGATVAVTAGSAAKLEACAALGADIRIPYRDVDFVAALREATDGRGADVILDAIGGAYLARNIDALAHHGRLVIIGNQSGQHGDYDPGVAMRKWASVHSTTLRGRSLDERRAIVADVAAHAWPLVQSGRVKPIVDSRYPLADARLAHQRMESSEHIGKLLLVP